MHASEIDVKTIYDTFIEQFHFICSYSARLGMEISFTTHLWEIFVEIQKLASAMFHHKVTKYRISFDKKKDVPLFFSQFTYNSCCAQLNTVCIFVYSSEVGS